MQFLYGKPIADEILDRLRSAISGSQVKPGLAVVLIGDDKASEIYVSLKEKRAQEIGMDIFRFDLPKTVSENEVIGLIGKLNGDAKIHGIVVQLPLPSGFDTAKIIASIIPEKDADGFSASKESAELLPVFPHAILRLIESIGEILENKQAVVVANSDEFGATMAEALRHKKISAQYFLSKDMKHGLEKLKVADIVISAVGKPKFIRGEMLKNGCLVIDGGIEKVGDKIVGDVDRETVEKVAGFLAPVPGGVGPLTIACLLENVYQAFKAQQRE